MTIVPYRPLRASRSWFLPVRRLRYHLRVWDADTAQPAHTVVMLHGWMDMSASFQFLADCLPADWRLVAPDWRGYGLTARPDTDCYWFPDYLADLDAIVAALEQPQVDLIAHSMGGNVAMLYAGVRPDTVRRVANLEGMGMPASVPAQAPDRYARWLDELRRGQRMAGYANLDAVARRLRGNNPRLMAERAAFLAGHWARENDEGRFEILGDPAHKVINPQLYQVPEVLACWRRIVAPVLLVVAEHTDDWHHFIHQEEYRQRWNAVGRLRRETLAGAGHMLHHDQPQALAGLLTEFLR